MKTCCEFHETASCCEGRACPARPASRSLLPTTSEGWGRLIGAVLGIAGCFFIAGSIGKYLNLF